MSVALAAEGGWSIDWSAWGQLVPVICLPIIGGMYWSLTSGKRLSGEYEDRILRAQAILEQDQLVTELAALTYRVLQACDNSGKRKVRDVEINDVLSRIRDLDVRHEVQPIKDSLAESSDIAGARLRCGIWYGKVWIPLMILLVNWTAFGSIKTLRTGQPPAWVDEALVASLGVLISLSLAMYLRGQAFDHKLNDLVAADV